MMFDLRAAKAYVGGLLATAGPSVSAFIIGLFESITSWDLPVNVEGVVLTAVTFALGWLGVYFTPNKSAAP